LTFIPLLETACFGINAELNQGPLTTQPYEIHVSFDCPGRQYIVLKIILKKYTTNLYTRHVSKPTTAEILKPRDTTQTSVRTDF
jgi:hypothetical protein